MNIFQKTDRLLHFSKNIILVRNSVLNRSNIKLSIPILRSSPNQPLKIRTKRKKRRNNALNPRGQIFTIPIPIHLAYSPVITLSDILIAKKKFQKTSNDNLKPLDSLYVEEVGTGSDTVVLLHGLARSLKYWEPMLNFMNKQKYSYVLPDLLGHGRSPSPDHLSYDIDTHLFFLFRDVVNKINKPFHLIGHSLGGLIALELAARAPEKILTLILISFPYFESEEMIKQHFDILHSLGHPLLNNKFMCKVCCTLICQNRNFWRPIIPFIVRNQPEYVVWDGMQHNFHSVYSTYEKCLLENRQVDDAAEFLSKVGLPIKLIHGGQDTIVPPERPKKFYQKFSQNTTLDIIEGSSCGHDLPLIVPELLADHITKILDESLLKQN